MYELTENGVITMFRGDTVALDVEMPLYSADGTPTGDVYELQDGDYLTLTVRALPSRTSPVLFSTKSTTTRILIVPSDTENIDPGEYSADIELTRANGYVETIFPLLSNLSSRARKNVINWKNFVLVGEVTE